MKRIVVASAVALIFAACSSSESDGTTAASGAGGAATSTAATMSASSATSASNSTTSASATTATTGAGGAGGGGGATGSGGAGAGIPTAADLLKLVQSCNQVSSGKYATDDGGPSTVPICGLTGAVFWQADMDIDCDGKTTAQCNINTDPAYQNQTAATDSNGDALDAASLPYVVVPSTSSKWSYKTAGLHLGSVVAVIYNNQIEYAVIGDTGPTAIIGEASYATASALGIDPDPSTGGIDSGVTYIAFTGSGAVQKPIEDHAAATALGQQLAQDLIKNNP